MMERMDVRIVLALALVALGFGLGSMLRGGGEPASHSAHETATSSAEAQPEPTIWTCSMHPQIQLPHPGKCPICGMDLIPQEGGGDAEAAQGPRMSMSDAAMKLAEVQTTEVVRKRPHVQVRMVGKVAFDETRQQQISAWVGGRIDRMYVDYTGMVIRKGDHLASIYSPELVSSQEELLQAIQAQQRLGNSGVGVLRGTAAKTVEASREKLRLLGLSAEQIDAIESGGTVEDHITIRSPIDGVVVAKKAVAGDYVKTGVPIFEIADLGHVWVKLDAYESDLVWLRYGQRVAFRAEAFPGQEIEGTIIFIDPVLDPRTRTAKVRVNVDNSDGELKPGMFVRAVVEAEIATGGRVVDESLRGKWISPMHPEVVKDHPGTCDVCGMPLVRAEDLGYVTAEPVGEEPLVIPASAPLLTGKRAVVYVRVPDADRPTFEGREVVLGPRAGDEYLVESGLSEGELVVTNGAFKIDSSMQIAAKPSMMSAAEDAPADAKTLSPERVALDVPIEFQTQLGRVVDGFLQLTDALAHDDAAKSLAAAKELPARLQDVDMKLLNGEVHRAEMSEWMALLPQLRSAVGAAAAAKDIDGLRNAVPALDAALARGVQRFAIAGVGDVREFHCPMAFDGKGANWLQSGETTLNPYYGAMMLNCGTQVRVLHEGEDE